MTQSRLVPATSPLRRLRRLPKLCGDKLCVLLIENGYHLQRECKASLERLGHKVISLVIGQEGSTQDISATMDAFLNAVITHKPDMMLTIDCLAFDTVNWMADVVDAIALPTAIWYVDSPVFICYGFLNPAPEHTTIFSWDQSYVPVLQQLGCKRVAHLPLATDTNMFHPGATPAQPAFPISFVGNTLQNLERRWHVRLAPEEHGLAETYRKALSEDRNALISISRQAKPPVDRNMLALAYANFRASKTYRHLLLRALPQGQLHVFGDSAWRMLLPRAHAHEGFAYGPKLAEVFRTSSVNFNATNLQMPCTVNQRVFDVPASGALLLTDHQTELEQYFEPGKEVLTYQSGEEAQDLARHYSLHPEHAKPIIARAQARVQAEHTYDHRVTKLVDIMRRNHQRGAHHHARTNCLTQANAESVATLPNT